MHCELLTKIALSEIVFYNEKRLNTFTAKGDLVKKKNVILLMICLVTSFVFASGQGEKVKEVLRIGINSEPVTVMTPSLSTSAMCQMMNKSTHSTLIDIDSATDKFIPDLAESWTSSDGGKVLTFNLRKGVKFHNGAELKASDVVFTFMERLPKGAIAALAKTIVKTEALDDYTVKMTLSGPQQDILYTISSPCASIVSKKAVEKEGNNGEKYGTGPYKIEEYVQGEYVRMVRFDGYFGEKPKTRELRWSILVEDSSRSLALETGEIDICYSPANSDIPYIRKNKDLEVIGVDGLNLYYLGFNTQVAPFNDPKVRQAIAQAVNKQDAIKVAFEGYASPAENVMAPAVPLYTPVKGYEYNISKAKETLKQSSVPNGFKCTVWVDRADEEQMCIVFKENLAKIGIDMQVLRLEATTLKASWKNSDYQMCLQKFGNTAGPDMSFSYVFAKTASANRSRVDDPKIDSAINAAAVMADAKKRAKMYADLNKYITDEAYWVPICIPQVFVGIHKGLKGAVYAGNASHDFTYAYMSL